MLESYAWIGGEGNLGSLWRQWMLDHPPPHDLSGPAGNVLHPSLVQEGGEATEEAVESADRATEVEEVSSPVPEQFK